MNKLNPESSCALCQKPVGEKGVTLANNNGICSDCFQICGFSPITPTNCLSITDILELLSIKNISIDDLKQNTDTEVTAPKDMDALIAEFGQDSQSHNREEPESFEAFLGLGATPVFAAPEQESKILNEIPIQKLPPMPILEDTSQDEIVPIVEAPVVPKADSSAPQPLENVLDQEVPINTISTEEVREETANSLPDTVTEPMPGEISVQEEPVDTGKLTEAVVADDVANHGEVPEDVPSGIMKEKSKRGMIFKISAIVLVSLITIGVMGTLLPQGTFFGKKDMATYANNLPILLVAGEANEYSQEPKIEKDGYVYMVPAGTYEATMLDSSMAFQGNITVETNNIVLGDGGVGSYQNISSQDLLPNESIILEVGKNQHVYISIETIVELVPVDDQVKL